MKSQWRYLTVYLLIGLASLFLATHATFAVPVSKPLQDIPGQLGSWRMISQATFTPSVLAGLRPSDYLFREYADSQGRRVSLYVGYHDGGPDSGPIHSPRHCLPGAGWMMLEEKITPLEVAGQQLNVVQSRYAKGGNQDLFVYWYMVKGEVLTNEYALKFAEIRNSMLLQRKDSAFIRISVSSAEELSDPTALAGDFIVQVFPHIKAALPM